MTDPEPLPRFVPLEHVQQELSIAYTQALARVRSGQLRAIKVGGRGQWRISLEALEEYVQARYAETAAMVAEESGDELPAPACEYGYPLNQLIDVLGEEHRERLREFSMMRASYSCPQHGHVMYVVDAERYVSLRSRRG